jgi:hypothetical protein
MKVMLELNNEDMIEFQSIERNKSQLSLLRFDEKIG